MENFPVARTSAINSLIADILEVLMLHTEAAYLTDEGKKFVRTSIECICHAFKMTAEDRQNMRRRDLIALYISENSELSEGDMQKAEDWKEIGDLFFNKGFYGEAVNNYVKAIRLNPRNTTALCQRAQAYSNIGIYDRAIEDCQAAIDLYPGCSQAFNIAATVHTKLRRWSDGYRASRNCYIRDPLSALHALKYELVLFQIHETVRSDLQLNRIAREHLSRTRDVMLQVAFVPDDEEINCARCRAIEQAQRVPDMQGLTQQMVLLKAEFLARDAITSLKSGALDKCIAQSREAIKTNPRCYTAFYTLGLALMYLEQEDKANKAFMHAITLEVNSRPHTRPPLLEARIDRFIGNNLLAYHGVRSVLEYFHSEPVRTRQIRVSSEKIAEAYKVVGDFDMEFCHYESAIYNYTKAIIFDPDNPDHFVSRALVHKNMWNTSAAIADCKTALELDPMCAKAYFVMGLANMNWCDWMEACLMFIEAQKLDPDNDVYELYYAEAKRYFNNFFRKLATPFYRRFCRQAGINWISSLEKAMRVEEQNEMFCNVLAHAHMDFEEDCKAVREIRRAQQMQQQMAEQADVEGEGYSLDDVLNINLEEEFSVPLDVILRRIIETDEPVVRLEREVSIDESLRRMADIISDDDSQLESEASEILLEDLLRNYSGESVHKPPQEQIEEVKAIISELEMSDALETYSREINSFSMDEDETENEDFLENNEHHNHNDLDNGNEIDDAHHIDNDFENENEIDDVHHIHNDYDIGNEIDDEHHIHNDYENFNEIDDEYLINNDFETASEIDDEHYIQYDYEDDYLIFDDDDNENYDDDDNEDDDEDDSEDDEEDDEDDTEHVE